MKEDGTFEAGDVVALKHGGLYMTVERVQNGGGGEINERINVLWFDSEHHLHRDCIWKDALKIVK